MKINKLIRALSAALALLLILLALPAFADKAETTEAAAPFEAVYDRAGVISDDTKALISDMSDRLFAQTGCRSCIVTLDFLDGKHITDVAKGLFSSLSLGENDVLTIVCVGEFSYTAYAGISLQKKLDSGKLGQLVGSNLTNKLMAPKGADGTARDYPSSEYDSALRAYVPKLCDAVSSAFGGKANFAESMQPTATPAAAVTTPAPTEKEDDSAAYSADNWLDRMMTWGTSVAKTTSAPFNYNENEKNSGMKVSFWQVILLLVILRLVFGGKHKGGKGPHRPSGRGGHPYR